MTDLPRLTIEAVPKTCWFSNVRDNVSKETWNKLKFQTSQKANHVCEICGGHGERWPVECHEMWLYDDDTLTQSLIGLIALCPACHEVKHFGLASMRGRGMHAKEHLTKVNGWTDVEADSYIKSTISIWRERSKHQWHLDISWLEQFGIHIEPKR